MQRDSGQDVCRMQADEDPGAAGCAGRDRCRGVLQVRRADTGETAGYWYMSVYRKVSEWIGKWAFHGCGRLKKLEIHHDPEEVGEWITNKNCTIVCPKGSKMEAYAKSYEVNVEYL